MRAKSWTCLLLLLPASVLTHAGTFYDDNHNTDSTNQSPQYNVNLSEVVVTGQGGAIQKRRLSSNVTSIQAKDLKAKPSARIDEMLQAALPNVQINMATSQPGTTSVFKSRGLSSAFLNATPIIYIDGVRVDNLNTGSALSGSLNGIGSSPYSTNDLPMGQTAASSALSDIPMENIDHIEYVTGGAATTLYGSDAANGVIQIFTRKGGHGRVQGSFTTQLGIDVANGQFYHFRHTKDLLHKTGFEQLYRINLDGGNEKAGFSLGASMSQNTGTIIHRNNENKKYDLRFGSHLRLNSILNYENSFGFTAQDYNRDRNGNQGLYTGLWFTECAAAATFTYTAEDGTTANYPTDIDAADGYVYNQMKQFVDRAEALLNNKESIRRFQTSQMLIAKPLPRLTLKATLGMDYRTAEAKEIVTNASLIHMQVKPEGTDDAGRINNLDRRYMSITGDVNGQYKLYTGDWMSHIITAGFQYFNTNDRQVSTNGYNVRDGAKIIAGAGTITANEWQAKLHNYGVYLQDNIGFLNRYYIDLGLRTDYNTAFGDNVGWQWYPKAGLSWILSDEPFMERLCRSGIVGSTRVFANYGIAGTYPPAFEYERTVSMSSYLNGQAASFGKVGNPDLGPEKKHSYEIGFQTSLLRNILSLGFTYYYTRTKDAIFNVPTLPSSGQLSSYLANVGDIENKGVELTLGMTPIDTRDWTLNLSASVNTNHNEVLSMGGALPFAIGGFDARVIQNVVEVGKPIGFLRGTKTTLDADGNPVTETLQDLGSTLPDVYGNFGLHLRWRKLNLNVSGDYQAGAYVYDFNGQFRFMRGLEDSRVDKALLGGGTQAEHWLDVTNCFVQRGDYLKIRNIGVDYTFNFAKRAVVKSLNLALNLYNPFTITSCPVDPEATLSTAQAQGGVSTSGINYACYSAPRQYVMTIKIDF